MNSSPDLKSGRTLAVFNSCGKIPSCKERLHKYVKGVFMNGKHNFNIEELRLSYPGEEDLREETNLITSDSVTGSRNKLYITLDFIKSPGVTVCGFISFDNVGPMLMKNSLNLLQITVFSLVKEWSLSLNLLFIFFLLFLFIVLFMMDHIFLELLLLRFNISL